MHPTFPKIEMLVKNSWGGEKEQLLMGKCFEYFASWVGLRTTWYIRAYRTHRANIFNASTKDHDLTASGDMLRKTASSMKC